MVILVFLKTKILRSDQEALTQCQSLFAYWTTVNYRDAYGIFAVNGILFNHEGPRRGETFVSRKITRAVSEIAKNRERIFYFGKFECEKRLGIG